MKHNTFLGRLMSKEDLGHVLDFIYSTLFCDSDSQLRVLIDQLGLLLPFKYSTCVLGSIGQKGLQVPYEHININYPEEWSRIYAHREYHHVDPIFKEHFKSFEIQYWSDTYRVNEPPPDFMALSSDFGLTKGYTYGMITPKRKRASLISVSGDSLDREPRTEFILRQVVPHLHQVLERIAKNKKSETTQPLTYREKEILKWTANGKTAWEVSVILSISERTVRFHITNIMRKLDAVSCIHAVAIAFDLGLIELV